MRNEGIIERVIQLTVANILFWVTLIGIGGIWKIVMFLLTGMIVVFVFRGFCPLYFFWGKISQNAEKKLTLNQIIFLWAYAFLLLVLGSRVF